MLAISGTTLYGYNLTNSLRFRPSATGYLSKTFASAGNRQKWTWSTWVKRGALGSTEGVFFGTSAAATDATTFEFRFGNDALVVNDYFHAIIQTSAVYRDTSAWYHVVLALDTTQASASDRLKLYVNGSQVTAFATDTRSTYITQNSNLAWNGTQVQGIGATNYTHIPLVERKLDGYLAETYFIDGQQLTPSSFGFTNSIGVWQPARYTGTYGTNGFYLPFTDNTALTTSSNVGLGKDFSGNGNYWTTNNISITSGVTYDSMKDVPTLTSATSSNFAVLNRNINRIYGGSTIGTYTDGNLKATWTSGGETFQAFGSIEITSSTPKVYWEVRNLVIGDSGNYPLSGIANSNQTTTSTNTTWFITAGGGVGVYASGTVYANAVLGSVTAPGATGVIGYAYDPATGKFWIAVNGVWQNSGDPAAGTNPAATLATTNNWLPVLGNYGGSGSSSAANFGQQPWAYTPPTGFVSLNTYNLSVPTIKAGNKYVNTIPFTAVNGAGSVTVGFQPDFTWIKDRQSTIDHYLHDSVRGYGNYLSSNTTGAAGTGGGVTAATSSGFNYSIGNSNNWVAWNWRAGQGTTSTNTSGSITSTVSVNANAGFSVVTYTGNGVNATVGHGLGVAPSMMFIKARNAVGSWGVYHSGLPTPTTGLLLLNTSDAVSNSATYWNSTNPSSTVFSLGTAWAAANFVAYCWTPIPGYSAFGSWQNTNSTDGTFVYCGFSPAVIILKNYDNAEHWYFRDIARQTYNVVAPSNNWLQPSTSNTEAANGATTAEIDVLSNGFKIRTTNPAAGEISYGTRNYIYAAWASNPFKYANAK